MVGGLGFERMVVFLDAARLERGREKTAKARAAADPHRYFRAVAEARYLLRKVFRLIEEEAKRAGVDPLAHQALIQIYGSEDAALRVKELAERLDIAPAFASSIVKQLAAQGYISRARDKQDARVAWAKVTAKAKMLLQRIDAQVQTHVDYFHAGRQRERTEAAVSVLMFYAGASLRPRRRGNGRAK
jgi:DNA-binding MarR family transcriptional regulator